MPVGGFDPYHKWLGIPPEEQPPTHYRLLGIAEFEADRDVIANAAGRQTFQLRQQKDGPQASLAERLLSEVAAAKLTLLSPEAKARYDQSLVPEVGLPAIDIVPVPTFRRKPVKSEGFKFNPKSLLLRSGILILIAATLLLLVYLSERRTAPPPDLATTTVLPSQSSDRTGAEGPTPPTDSPAAAAPALAAGDRVEPADPAEAETAADRSDPDAKGNADSGAMESEAADTAGDPPSPVDTARSGGDVPADESTPAADAAPAEEKPGEAAADVDPNKTPVPSENDLAQAKRSVRAAHKAELAKAKTADDREALAKSLLIEARNMGDNSPKRYALFLLAIDQAAAGADFSSAADGWNELAERFQVDALTGRCEMLKTASKTKRVDALQSALRALVDEATEKDRYDLVRKALEMLAKSDPSEAGPIETELESLDALATFYSQVQAAFEKLKTDPADPAANRAAGEFLSFGKRDWSAGLLLLSRSDDAALKRLAATELTQPKGSKAQLRMADAWWDFAADQGDRLVADSAKSRARFWYMEALPDLTGAARAKAEERATLEARVHGDSSSAAKITSANFKGKLQGNVSYDAETGDLTIAYDFRDPSQAKDFDGDSQVAGGQLDVADQVALRHVVKFKSLRMTGTVAMKSNVGDVIRGSAGLAARRDASTVKISSGKENVSSSENGPADDDLTLPFELNTREKLVVFRLGDLVIGKPMAESEPGQIEVCGGEAGAQFSGLVMSGQPDVDWLADFLALPRTETEKNPSPASSSRPKLATRFERIQKIVLWNEHNSVHNNSGTRKCNLVLSRGGKSVWQKRDLGVPWEPDEPSKLEVDVPQILADSVRVEITATNRDNTQSGGLAEVEVFDKLGDSVTAGARVFVSAEPSPNDPRKGATLLDGITDSKDEKVGYWLLPVGQLGWADIRLLPQEAPLPAPKQAPAAASKEPAKTGGKPRKSLDAKIYACCDDAFELHVNGVPVLDGKEREASSGGVALAAGDVIAVKATNFAGKLGFCCVIKFSNGQLITTSDGWKAYVPDVLGQWSAPKQIKDVGPVVMGNSAWPPNEAVETASGVDAAQIWAAGGEEHCYLVFVVGTLDIPRRKPAK